MRQYGHVYRSPNRGDALVKITVVGAGAMGSLVAARLTASMNYHAEEPGGTPELERVLLYGRQSEHLERIREHGLELTERDGQTNNIRLEVSSDPADVTGSDVVIVLVKAWATGEACAPLAPYLDRHAVVLTLQNGLGNAKALREVLVHNGVRPHIWMGVTTQAAVRTSPGKASPPSADAPRQSTTSSPPSPTPCAITAGVPTQSPIFTAGCGVNSQLIAHSTQQRLLLPCPLAWSPLTPICYRPHG